MMNTITKGIIISILCFISKYSYATHIAGADLTYEYLGNHQYKITYTFYRDCIGVDAESSVTLNYGSGSCNIQSEEILYAVAGTGQLISFVCPGAITTCQGGTEPGIQKWEYTGIITISQQCPDWSFSVEECCRNAAITTIVSPDDQDMYIEANLNNTISENSSPVFSNVPIAFECIGQDNYYNHGGFDAEGDSLVYSFFIPYHSPNSPLAYNPGYSLADPITSSPAVRIDRFTGDVFMHPTATEIGVIAVQITEYRNGNLVGAVVRDIQIYTVNCSNNLPAASGINGTPSFSYTACAGGQICFDIFTSDPDAGDRVSALWNHTIPAATFTVDSTSLLPIIHFCWSPTPADIRPQPYFFTVTVHDDACPSVGVQSFAYSIYINSLTTNIISTNVSCNGGHDGSASVLSGTNNNFHYLWFPNLLTTSSVNHLAAGDYVVDITDTLGCAGTFRVQISEPPPLVVNVTGNGSHCMGTTGNAFVTASGGTGDYNYAWSTNPPMHSQSIAGLSAGTYSVIATDENNCSATDSIVISASGSFVASVSNVTNATCQFGENGIASITATGGVEPYTYLWEPGGNQTNADSNLAPGSYTIIVRDYLDCPVSVNVHIGYNLSAPIINLGNDTVICSGSSLMLDAGNAYSYLWSDNSTTQTISVSQDGRYNVLIADSAGCENFDEINVDFITCIPHHPAPNFPLVTVYPNPADGQINISITRLNGIISSLKLYDAFSTLMWFSNTELKQEGKVKIDVSSYNPGVYYLEVNTDSDFKTIRIIII